MLHLCFAAALRVSGLVTAQLADLSLRGTASLLVQGKGRRERCLPLWKQTAADLRAWLAVRGENPALELFLNATDKPMSRAGFEYVLDKHVQTAAAACPALAGRSISPHQLRHSCALIMLQATADIRKVALWLGTPMCAPPRSTCAWTPTKSWRPSKRCYRRNCAAADSRPQTR